MVLHIRDYLIPINLDSVLLQAFVFYNLTSYNYMRINMNNNAFDNFINQDFKGLSEWFSNLNPYEFTFVATIIGGIIAPLLTTAQQNSLGNFFEQLGQTLETISAQAQTNSAYNQNNQVNNNSCNYNNEINKLKEQIG